MFYFDKDKDTLPKFHCVTSYFIRMSYILSHNIKKELLNVLKTKK